MLHIPLIRLISLLYFLSIFPPFRVMSDVSYLSWIDFTVMLTFWPAMIDEMALIIGHIQPLHC